LYSLVDAAEWSIINDQNVPMTGSAVGNLPSSDDLFKDNAQSEVRSQKAKWKQMKMSQ